MSTSSGTTASKRKPTKITAKNKAVDMHQERSGVGGRRGGGR